MKDLSETFPDVVASWLRDQEMGPPVMAQRLQIADMIDAMWGALMMVRDADNDCARDGLPTMPEFARGAVEAALDNSKVRSLGSIQRSKSEMSFGESRV